MKAEMKEMGDWRKEMESALDAFVTAASLAGELVRLEDLHVEYLSAPHKPPASLPAGKMAIYAFWWNGEWLKIGQAGPKSVARYASHHYNPNSSMSNLAKSLSNDPQMNGVLGFSIQNPGQWVKTSTCRVNILLSSQRRKELLSLLEVFLHVRFNPRYEG
jgi:hypothetical protein